MMMAGYAEQVLPVPSGQPMMGHTRVRYEARLTHDPLLCKALIFRDGCREVGIVMLDLCMVDAEFVAEAKRAIANGEALLIAATHTHAGPAVFSLYEAPVMDTTVRQAIIDTIAHTVALARTRTTSVRMRYGSAACATPIGFYRRLRKGDGSTAMNWEPFAPDEIASPLGHFDARVRVLELSTEGSHVVVVNYPLHPAILDYTNDRYSRDYPYYLEMSLKQMLGENTQVLFANGCCGNINHINYADPDSPRRGYAASERVGFILASAVMEALRTASACDADRVGRAVIPIELERIGVPEDLLMRARRALQEPQRQDETDGLPFTLQAPSIVRLAELEHEKLATTASVTCIGPLAVFGFPGEVTHEIERELAGLAGSMPWMAIELTDDAIGYIAHRDAYAEGGYEVQAGATKVASGAAEAMLAHAWEGYVHLVGRM